MDKKDSDDVFDGSASQAVKDDGKTGLDPIEEGTEKSSKTDSSRSVVFLNEGESTQDKTGEIQVW